MLSGFEKKIADFVRTHELMDSANRVLLAVSGGADSTALLYSMHALRAEGVFAAELLCAHLNHQLRGAEADADERFVVEQTAELGLGLKTRRLDVRGFARRNKLSIETAARQLRLESMMEIAEQENCDCIATAHQKDDNAETILQRLIRGTGLRGLGGIWPERTFVGKVRFVRPMLSVTRQEVVEYLQGRKLRWRKDRTNQDCSFRRNYIRHRLLPALQADCLDSLAELLSDLAERARAYYGIVCTQADSAWAESADCESGRIALNLQSFLTLAPPVKVELVRRSLHALGSGERDLKQQHYEAVLDLAERHVGGRTTELPGGFVARRDYSKLVFGQARDGPQRPNEATAQLKVPGRTRFGQYMVKASIIRTQHFPMDFCFRSNDTARQQGRIERFDLHSLAPPLVVRHRRAGDRFVPLGLGAEKKVGKFLSDARLRKEEREKTLVVADREKVIWVWPVRMSELAKVSDSTRDILQLEITCSQTSDREKEADK